MHLINILVYLFLAVLDARPASDSRDPLGKHVVKSMDALVATHVAWNNWSEWSRAMQPFWANEFVYDTVEGFPGAANYTGLQAWFEGEHLPFNNAFWPVVFSQMIFLGEKQSATTTTYAVGEWIGPLGKLRPRGAQNKQIIIRILDFYRLVPDNSSAAGGRISYNWMMIDMVSLLLQSGHRVLPKPNLSEDLGVRPPRAFDGSPAPASFFVAEKDTEASRSTVLSCLQHEWVEHKGVCVQWADDLTWYGPVGIGVAHNKDQYQREFVQKVYGAFSDIKLQIDVLTCEGNYCGAHGYIHGVHVGEWLGQSATGKHVRLRFRSHWHIRDGVIIEGWTMLDLPAFFKQLGINLFSLPDIIPNPELSLLLM